MLSHGFSLGYGFDGFMSPLFAHGVTAGELIVLLLMFLWPFILSGALFIGAVVAFFRNRVVEAVCLVLAVLFFLLGVFIIWRDQEPVWARHDSWASQVATDPESLSGSYVNDRDVRLLRETSRLKHLKLRYCCVTNDAMETIGGLSQLESLDIRETCIDDAGLVHLEQLPRLRKLSLYGLNKVTDRGLRHLRPLVRLELLDLSHNRSITDAGLQSIEPLQQVRELDLAFCGNITDAGLVHLEGLPSLEWLNLTETKITDAGITSLAKMKNLRALSVDLTQMTEAGVEKLQRLLPECKIYYGDSPGDIDSDKGSREWAMF